MSKRTKISSLILSVLILFTLWCCLVILVVPPIGAIPEGKTVILFKPDRLFVQGKIDFLETPDHFQFKNLGRVTIFGRLVALSAMAQEPIIVRLPYSATLEYLANAGMSWE